MQRDENMKKKIPYDILTINYVKLTILNLINVCGYPEIG